MAAATRARRSQGRRDRHAGEVPSAAMATKNPSPATATGTPATVEYELVVTLAQLTIPLRTLVMPVGMSCREEARHGR